MTKEEKVFYFELGERVTRLRKQSHITQVEMAHELGVSQQQIASFEGGRVKIPIATLPRLSKVLDTSIDEILGVEKQNPGGPPVKLQQQMEKIARLPKAKQNFIIEMLDAILIQEHQKR